MNKIDALFGDARLELAPMAGYTDVAFRSICKKFCDVVTVTEMVSSKALVMGNSATNLLLAREPNDTKTVVQIFGHEPDVMAESVELPELKGFDGIDVNMGCPVRKIVSSGDGSALLEKPELASKIIRAVKDNANGRLVSVKFRLGVNDQSGAVDFAKMCADSGADYVTVHFRTRSQMYAGKADFSLLPEIVKCGVPVIANGDVTCRDDYLKLTDAGAYGVAVGRGALGRPWIFAEITGQNVQTDICALVHEQAETLSKYYPDRVVANEMKKHVAFYLKGRRGVKQIVTNVNNSHTVSELLRHVDDFLKEHK